MKISRVLPLSVFIAAACTPTHPTGETDLSSKKGEAVRPIKGTFKATEIIGYTSVHNDERGVRLSPPFIDEELMKLTVDISENGEGSLTGQSRCREIVTRFTPAESTTRGLLIDRGLAVGASFVTTAVDLSKCETQLQEKPDQPLVKSSVKVSASLEANRKPSENLPSNLGFLGVDTNSFAAQRECKKLNNMMLVTVKVSEETNRQARACIGFTDKDSKKLRLILLPGLASHAFMADYQLEESK
ncbi:MAG: hypothetical protein RIR26_1379 [Pseudomonadota bacterium]|jgi:hypothetical protein